MDGTSPPDHGVGAVRAALARMFDAGEKEKLLEAVEYLLTRALRDADALAARVKELTRQLYGQKKERISPYRLALAFDALRQEQAQQEDAAADAPEAPVVPQRPSASVPRLRRQRGRRALPAHLPREEIRLQPTEAQRAATSGSMRKMSEERSEVLEYVQGHFKVLVYVREV